jgi:hypothetical protein
MRSGRLRHSSLGIVIADFAERRPAATFPSGNTSDGQCWLVADAGLRVGVVGDPAVYVSPGSFQPFA